MGAKQVNYRVYLRQISYFYKKIFPTMKVALLLSRDYRLLSVAAVLDVFEAVNKIYKSSGQSEPFDINLYILGEDKPQNPDSFYGYPVVSIEEETKLNLILVPSFSTDNISESIKKNHALSLG